MGTETLTVPISRIPKSDVIVIDQMVAALRSGALPVSRAIDRSVLLRLAVSDFITSYSNRPDEVARRLGIAWLDQSEDQGK